MRRIYVTRALLAGLAALLAASVMAYGVAPLLRLPPFDPVRALAAGLAGVEADDPARLAATGWPLALALAEGAALVFAALWDVLPPRARRVSKALVFVGLVVLALRPGLAALPAALGFALALGLTYRPHPAPPERTPSVSPPARGG